MPLQSGNSSTAGSALVADARYFFIQFSRPVLQEQVADFRRVYVKPVHLHQTYHVIYVFHNPPGMAVFDGVAFESKQVAQDTTFAAAAPGGPGMASVISRETCHG